MIEASSNQFTNINKTRIKDTNRQNYMKKVDFGEYSKTKMVNTKSLVL